jgi:hypothetical protein
MQKIVITLFLVNLIAGCNPDIDQLPSNCIPVKYVRGICGQAVLEIQDPKYYDTGENADGDSHVFLAMLECFTDTEIVKDKLFYVELNPSNFNSECAVCLALVNYSGNKHYNVRVHPICGNTEE